MRWQPSRKDWRSALVCAAMENGKRLMRQIWCRVTWSTLPAGRLCRRMSFSSAANMSCDQAALTGESLPVSKKVGDQAYSGSIAKQGSMTGLVTATGGNTFFGRTAKLVGSAGAVSHSQRAVTQVGDFLLLLALVL